MAPTEKSQANGDADPSLQVPAAVIQQAEAAASNETGPPHAVRESARRRTVVQSPETGSNSHAEKAGMRPADTEPPIEQRPAPMYSDTYGQVDLSQDGFDTKAKVSNDGRININIRQNSRRLSDLLVPALRNQLNIQKSDEPDSLSPQFKIPPFGGKADRPPPPPMNIVIHVVGSRGDVQPFVALGKVLKEQYGHRVRLATHGTFRQFVEENGLEYFNIGGDPAELMAFMVKNPGLMPGMDSLRSGDIGKRRKGIYEILNGCWRSCIECGDGTGPSASEEFAESRVSFDSAIGMENDPSVKPFVADAIIANPPSFAHVHCAEKLGIPLHLMFTMPWSPTQSFPHPLANIQSSNADDSISNFISYAMVEMMTWQGLGDMINRFREKTLGLEEVSVMWAPGMASRLRIPYTYCWSPALIPKPKDWGSHISISGFYFLSLANTYTPDPDLAAFLAAGPPPVYIGFGSIVVDDPNAMTKLIFEAVKKMGQRALVSKGWGGFGADALGIPDGVFMLGNVPHDWLFKHVSCVVHHGGAGTTAAGIALGKPTVVVPFFGDQPFWGAMVARAGAGPTPVPNKHLTAETLANAILEALKPTTLERAQALGARIKSEMGSENGAKSFHDKLGLDTLRCAICPARVAVWRLKRTTIRLSAFAATTLGNEGLLDFKDLKLYRPKEYDAEDGPWDPITGGASSLIGTLSSLAMGVADFPVEILKAMRPRPADDESKDEAYPTERSRSGDIPKVPLDSRNSFDSNAENAGKLDLPSPSGEIQPTISGQTSPTNELSPVNSETRQKSYGSGAMASVFRHSSTGSRSRESSPNRQHRRTNSAHHGGPISLDTAVNAGRSVKQIVSVGMKSPMDFTLSIARGFHNAPKLYGDESVRQPDKVTGIQSGLKVAGKEFGYGMYDGVSGLVTQPFDGAKKEGVAGLIKGFGKGVGGLILKPGAAFWGLPGYTFKGIYKEIQNHLGSSVQNYIVAARTAQGYDDWHRSTPEERLWVVSEWQTIQIQLAKEKEHVRQCSFHGTTHPPTGFLKTRHLSFDERKKLAEEKKKSKAASKSSSHSRPRFPSLHPSFQKENTEADFEKAIHDSVAATSKGNPEEDKVIENAIRASVKELQTAENDKNAIERAIKASVAEAARERRERAEKSGAAAAVDDAEHDKELEEALHRSLTHGEGHEEQHPLARADFNDSGLDTDEDDDAELKHAIQLSKSAASTAIIEEEPETTHANGNNSTHEDEDLKEAIRRSQTTYTQDQEKLERSKTEEEIVMEYMKKQSLAETRFREGVEKKTTTAKPAAVVNDTKPAPVVVVEDVAAQEEEQQQAARPA